MSYADLPTIRDELDVTSDEIGDDQLGRYQRRATRLIDERLPTENDPELLEDLELLVTGHFAYGDLAGGPNGQRVERVRQESTTVKFATGPDGTESPYWHQAVLVDDRIESEPFRSYTL